MTPQAKAGWRWRLLMDRAVIDAGMFASKTPSAAVAAALVDIAKTYSMQCPGPSAVCKCIGKPGSSFLTLQGNSLPPF